MDSIGSLIAEKTIIVKTQDSRLAGGFTQLPNSILKHQKLPLGAKIVYALLLSYAWNDNQVFPGQQTLADDAGASRQTVSKHMKELVATGLVTIERRGQGKTSIYTLHDVVDNKKLSTDDV